MKKKQKTKGEKKASGQYRWAATVFLLAVALSAVLSLASETMLAGAGMAAALLILALFIGVGILFDIIGVAVTAADPKPFHAMASHKEKGAKEALMLLRNAGRVSSVCNDVVGDICGIVSGAAGAVLGVIIAGNGDATIKLISAIGVSAVIGALTVGGKAIFKHFAIKYNKQIVFGFAKFTTFFKREK